MNTRKSKTIPIIIAFIFILFIVYLFTSIEQTTIVFEKTKNYSSDITVREVVTGVVDGKRINSLNVVKIIKLPDKFINDDEITSNIKESLNRTHKYLGKNVTYRLSDNSIITTINIKNNELILLDNISFNDSGNAEIIIDSNTKSSNVIALSVGDSYSEGEFMKRLRTEGYSCK